MPVLGVDDQGTRHKPPLDLAVDQRHDPLALADVEAALGIGEVVLHIDDDQRRRPVMVDHHTALLGGCRPIMPPAGRGRSAGSLGQLDDLPVGSRRRHGATPPPALGAPSPSSYPG
jgi:hypothetical protein